MSTRPGRNDPCPCGSGKKFKLCHGRDPAPDPDAELPVAGVRRALEWLGKRHRKALERATLNLLYEELWPEDGPHPEDVDPELMEQIIVNVNEWILASGTIEIRRTERRVNALLLAADGPPLNDAQREFIVQLGSRPLGLYTVTDVEARRGVTLADALYPDREPIFVHDESVSDTADPGMLFGARILRIGARDELSGALYPFLDDAREGVAARIREALAQDIPAEERNDEQSWLIFAEWLDNVLMLPDDGEEADDDAEDNADDRRPSGKREPATRAEAPRTIVDHYRVVDADALKAKLDYCAELRDDGSGWSRFIDANGNGSTTLQIVRGEFASRKEVHHPDPDLADAGRAWFEALAGESVRHLGRESAELDDED